MLFFKKKTKNPQKPNTQYTGPKDDYDSRFFTQGIPLNLDDSIDKSLLLLIERVGSPSSEFILSKDDIRYIDKNSHTKKGLQFLTLKIFQHIKMPFFNYDIMLTVGNSGNREAFTVDEKGNAAKYTPNDGTAGQYSSFRGKPCITINIEDYYPLNTIIAIACHECLHHFLRNKHIEFSDAAQNEILTDVAVMYLGFGAYMKKGYSPITINIGFNTDRIITVGYVKLSEISAINKKIKTISRNYLDEHNRKQYISQLAEKANTKMALFHEVYERYSSCLTCIVQKSNANLTAEDFSSLQDWLICADHDRGLEKKLQHEFQSIRTQEDSIRFSGQIESTCTDLTRRIVVLSKYL